MKKTQPVWLFILIASLSAITAIAVERSFIGLPNDKLDKQIQALEEQLARSQAQRDSLNFLLASHQDTLQMLVAEESFLETNLEVLKMQLAKQDSILDVIRIQSPSHEITTDSLLNDLNAIVGILSAGGSTGDDNQ